MFDEIREACTRLVTNYNDFWLLSAISDNSYEEGAVTKWYTNAVESFRDAGVADDVIRQMHLGINGNVEEILLELGVRIDERNRRNGPDFRISRESPHAAAVVEVKMLFDCTQATYYPKVAADRAKCDIQIVFFTQLPHFWYPPGRWYGVTNAKARQTIRVGIRAQFEHLLTLLPHRPTWPDGEPFVHDLRFPTNIATADMLLRRYEKIFVPSVPWKFNALEQLRDAKVGVAVWKVR